MKFAVPVLFMLVSAVLLAYFGYVCHSVLPVCLGYFEGMSLMLPLPTQILVGVTKFIRATPHLYALAALLVVALIGLLSARDRGGKVGAGLIVALSAGLATMPYLALGPLCQLLGSLENGSTPGMYELYELGLAQQDLKLSLTPKGPLQLEKPAELSYQIFNAGNRSHRIGPVKFSANKKADIRTQGADRDIPLLPAQKVEGLCTAVFHKWAGGDAVHCQVSGVLPGKPDLGVYLSSGPLLVEAP